jgi:hypothetical protein
VPVTVSAGLPRRLGLVSAPEPGESLAFWIDRLGKDMWRPPGPVADDLDLRVVLGAVQRPLSLLFGIASTDEQRAAVRAATGVSAEVFDGMHLSVYDGTVLDLSDLAEDKVSVQRVWFREWPPPLRIRLTDHLVVPAQPLADPRGPLRLQPDPRPARLLRVLHVRSQPPPSTRRANTSGT